MGKKTGSDTICFDGHLDLGAVITEELQRLRNIDEIDHEPVSVWAATIKTTGLEVDWSSDGCYYCYSWRIHYDYSLSYH